MAQSGKSNNSEIALAERKGRKNFSFCEHWNQIKCIIFIYFLILFLLYDHCWPIHFIFIFIASHPMKRRGRNVENLVIEHISLVLRGKNFVSLVLKIGRFFEKKFEKSLYLFQILFDRYFSFNFDWPLFFKLLLTVIFQIIINRYFSNILDLDFLNNFWPLMFKYFLTIIFQILIDRYFSMYLCQPPSSVEKI